MKKPRLLCSGQTGRQAILLFANALLIALGIVIIVLAIILLRMFYIHYLDFVSPYFIAAPVVLIVAGVFSIFVALYGLGILKLESPKWFLTFSFVLIFALALCLAASILSFLLRETIIRYFSRVDVRQQLEAYDVDPVEKERWDLFHEVYTCCGGFGIGEGYRDWLGVNDRSGIRRTSVPDSCCRSKYDGCGARAFDKGANPIEFIHTNGCMTNIRKVLQSRVVPIILVCAIGSLLMALIELLLLLFACCFASHVYKRRRLEEEQPEKGKHDVGPAATITGRILHQPPYERGLQSSASQEPRHKDYYSTVVPPSRRDTQSRNDTPSRRDTSPLKLQNLTESPVTNGKRRRDKAEADKGALELSEPIGARPKRFGRKEQPKLRTEIVTQRDAEDREEALLNVLKNVKEAEKQQEAAPTETEAKKKRFQFFGKKSRSKDSIDKSTETLDGEISNGGPKTKSMQTDKDVSKAEDEREFRKNIKDMRTKFLYGDGQTSSVVFEPMYEDGGRRSRSMDDHLDDPGRRKSPEPFDRPRVAGYGITDPKKRKAKASTLTAQHPSDHTATLPSNAPLVQSGHRVASKPTADRKVSGSGRASLGRKPVDRSLQPKPVDRGLQPENHAKLLGLHAAERTKELKGDINTEGVTAAARKPTTRPLKDKKDEERIKLIEAEIEGLEELHSKMSDPSFADSKVKSEVLKIEERRKLDKLSDHNYVKYLSRKGDEPHRLWKSDKVERVVSNVSQESEPGLIVEEQRKRADTSVRRKKRREDPMVETMKRERSKEKKSGKKMAEKRVDESPDRKFPYFFGQKHPSDEKAKDFGDDIPYIDSVSSDQARRVQGAKKVQKKYHAPANPEMKPEKKTSDSSDDEKERKSGKPAKRNNKKKKKKKKKKHSSSSDNDKDALVRNSDTDSSSSSDSSTSSEEAKKLKKRSPRDDDNLSAESLSDGADDVTWIRLPFGKPHRWKGEEVLLSENLYSLRPERRDRRRHRRTRSEPRRRHGRHQPLPPQRSFPGREPRSFRLSRREDDEPIYYGKRYVMHNVGTIDCLRLTKEVFSDKDEDNYRTTLEVEDLGDTGYMIRQTTHGMDRGGQDNNHVSETKIYISEPGSSSMHSDVEVRLKTTEKYEYE